MTLTLLLTGVPLPVSAVPVETGKVGPTFNLPELALLQRLNDITTKTFDNELDKVLPVDLHALEVPTEDNIVGQGDGVVVELEGVDCILKDFWKKDESPRQ